MKLWLIGMMGSGKTTVGRAAASRMGVPFIDTDERVEKAAGMAVSEIWRSDGEPGFRKIEAEVVARIAEKKGRSVIATGGGVPLDPDNRRAMSASGKVAWLKAEPAVLASRVGGSGRPLLGVDVEPQVALSRYLEERLSDYEDAADFEIDVNLLAVSEVVDQLVGIWPR